MNYIRANSSAAPVTVETLSFFSLNETILIRAFLKRDDNYYLFIFLPLRDVTCHRFRIKNILGD